MSNIYKIGIDIIIEIIIALIGIDIARNIDEKRNQSPVQPPTKETIHKPISHDELPTQAQNETKLIKSEILGYQFKDETSTTVGLNHVHNNVKSNFVNLNVLAMNNIVIVYDFFSNSTTVSRFITSSQNLNLIFNDIEIHKYIDYFAYLSTESNYKDGEMVKGSKICTLNGTLKVYDCSKKRTMVYRLTPVNRNGASKNQAEERAFAAFSIEIQQILQNLVK